jgi:hypothetical protein
MDISAHAISLADRPQRAVWVTSIRMRGKTDPPSPLILSQTSAGKGVWGHHVIACPFNALSDQADWAAAFGASTRRKAVSFAGARTA